MKLVITEWRSVCSDNEISCERFKDFGELTVYPYTKDEELLEHIGDADIVLCNKVPMTAEIIGACPNLKYIGLMATGYNNIDLQAAEKAGITVCNAGEYSTNAVAQYVFAQILYYYNKLHLYDDDVRKGGWINSPSFSYFPFQAYELCGRTLAVIGFGSIGRKVAEIGSAFGMNVIVNTRSVPENCPYEIVSVSEAFSRADILTIHTPLTPQTKGLVSRENIDLMKKNALIVNSARGPIVDEYALADALKGCGIAAAALDVLENEPMLESTPLKDIPNCMITPHIAWSPVETRQRLLNIVYGNLKAFTEGKPINVVN